MIWQVYLLAQHTTVFLTKETVRDKIRKDISSILKDKIYSDIVISLISEAIKRIETQSKSALFADYDVLSKLLSSKKEDLNDFIINNNDISDEGKTTEDLYMLLPLN